MRTVKIVKLPNRNGWYVRWFEQSKARYKQCNTKQEAEAYRHGKYQELNTEVYTAIPLPWSDAVSRYMEWREISGFKTKKDIKWFLAMFHRTCPIQRTSDLTQSVINKFLMFRKDDTGSNWTVKGDIQKLRAFTNWLTKHRYAVGQIEYPAIKTGPATKGKILSLSDLYGCFQRCRDKNEQLNYMVSLCTGLRKEDVGKLDAITDDLTDDYANKTGKWLDLPIPPSLALYAKGETLKRLGRKRWETITGDATHHDLRRTMSQMVNDAGNLDIASELLQHSDKRITKEFYLKAGKRAAINAVFEPLFKDWLKKSLQ